MGEPAVSVAMPVRNCAPTVALAVRSILNQTYENWTLILIDDGSTDQTLSRLEALVTDNRVHVYADGRALGLAARLNQAIEIGSAAYFARMDGDDVAYPERLARQVALLESDQGLDLVGASMLVFGTGGEMLGWRQGPHSHEEICASPRSGFRLGHPTFCGRQEWFQTYRYDVRAIRCEDQDLLRRSFRHSRFANVPEILLGYREQEIALGSVLRGRIYGVGSVARDAGGWLRLDTARAAAEQAAKGLVDVAASSLSLEPWLLRHRRRPLHQAEHAHWQWVWELNHGP